MLFSKLFSCHVACRITCQIFERHHFAFVSEPVSCDTKASTTMTEKILFGELFVLRGYKHNCNDIISLHIIYVITSWPPVMCLLTVSSKPCTLTVFSRHHELDIVQVLSAGVSRV